MALIDEVRKVCDRLAPHGWGDLLAQHGLDIGVPDLTAVRVAPASPAPARGW